MAFEVTTTGVLEHTNLSMMVVGPPGIGKTPFALTSPKPYLLNAEAGVASVAHINAPVSTIDSSEKLLEIRTVLALPEEERNDTLGFEVGTVVLDTIDEIQRIVIHERLQYTKKPEMGPGDWGWLADEMNAIVRGFRSLDMNVIFVCHTKDQQEGETGVIYRKPDMAGAFAHQLPAAVDIVGLIERQAMPDGDEGGAATKHFFVTDAVHHYDWLKNRGRIDPSIEMNFADDYERIHESFFEGLEVAKTDVRTVETVADNIPPEPEPEQAEAEVQPEAKKTVDEAREQISNAERVMAAAEKKAQKKKDKERAVLTEPSTETLEGVDISRYLNGDPIKNDSFQTGGFRLLPNNTLRNAPNTRFVYHLEDGTDVLSVNQLETGVVPVRNLEIDSGIFCQKTGVEVTRSQANVSRIKNRKVLSESEFEKALA